MSEHQVMVYALSTCSHCRNARELLDDSGVQYDCIEVDLTEGEERDRVVAQVREANPSLSFPTIVIDNDVVIVGFKEQAIREALELQ